MCGQHRALSTPSCCQTSVSVKADSHAALTASQQARQPDSQPAASTPASQVCSGPEALMEATFLRRKSLWGGSPAGVGGCNRAGEGGPARCQQRSADLPALPRGWRSSLRATQCGTDCTIHNAVHTTRSPGTGRAPRRRPRLRPRGCSAATHSSGSALQGGSSSGRRWQQMEGKGFSP